MQLYDLLDTSGDLLTDSGIGYQIFRSDRLLILKAAVSFLAISSESDRLILFICAFFFDKSFKTPAEYKTDTGTSKVRSDRP